MDWTVYGALIGGFVAICCGTTALVIRSLRLWRDWKRLNRHLAKSLLHLATSAERTGELVEQVSDQRDLEGSLARLAVALRRFNVLRAAVDEVAESLARVAAVYPRK